MARSRQPLKSVPEQASSSTGSGEPEPPQQASSSSSSSSGAGGGHGAFPASGSSAGGGHVAFPARQRRSTVCMSHRHSSSDLARPSRLPVTLQASSLRPRPSCLSVPGLPQRASSGYSSSEEAEQFLKRAGLHEESNGEQGGFLKRASMSLGAGLGGLGSLVDNFVENSLLGDSDSDSSEPPLEPPPVQSSSSTGSGEQEQQQQASSSHDGGGSNAGNASRRSPLTFRAAARAVMVANSLAASYSQTVDMPQLLQKVRGPFGRLLNDVRKPSTSFDRVVLGAEAKEELVRVRLCGYVLGCCEAAISDMSIEEARLWDAFVSADTTLTGTVGVHHGELAQLLTDSFGESDQIETWLMSMAEIADDNGQIDFVDLLEWYTQDPEIEGLWLSTVGRVRASFWAGLGQIMDFAPTEPQMRTELVSELRLRCAKTAPGALAETAAAYERTLLLIKSWQCENRLATIVSSAAVSDSKGRSAPQPVHVLLNLLRNIDSLLDPTERVLWEVISCKDNDFVGSFTKQEVLEGIGELLVYTLERELSTQSEDFEELQQLRLECQRRSVESLFQRSTLTVTISDVIRWWWDLPKEYRIAAGLTVPAALVRRSVHRKPEQMFNEKIRRIASSVPATTKALHGHVRVYAELHALMVRRTIEGIHYNYDIGTTRT